MFHAQADPSQTADITVNIGDQRQHIDGFGAADPFLESWPLTDAQADLFFSTSSGIGLTFLRTGVDSTGATMGAYSNAVKAALRGAKVWVAPWTAPAAYKDNSSLTNGGNLLVADYANWANILAGFQATMVANGGPDLYAVSVQNEPDFTASYVSMLYTDSAMAAFIDVLGPKLQALSPAPLLISAEPANWGNLSGYLSSIASDSTAQSYLSIAAAHQYSGVSAPSSNFRPIWETEMSGFDAFDPSMSNGMTVAQWIYDGLNTGGVSAWHWWWLLGFDSNDNEGLIGTGTDPDTTNATMTKRYYVLGNYSKFVRPDFYRVGFSGSISGVNILTFANPLTKGFVAVMTNTNGSTSTMKLNVNGLKLMSLVPWVTSASLNLSAQSPVTITGTGGVFNLSLPATSVTSFVGTGV